MKARPIIFSAPMVRALLAGTKSQTRRVVDPQPPRSVYPERPGFWCTTTSEHGVSHGPWECPYGQPGDLLYVKEALRGDGQPGDRRPGIVRYALDGEMVLTGGQDHLWQWKRPTLSVHYCPRWASRLTLRITDVRVQRVQDISEEDARAEGMRNTEGGAWGCEGAIESFGDLWDSINAARGYGWDANPWVWALTLTVERRNVDDVLVEDVA